MATEDSLVHWIKPGGVAIDTAEVILAAWDKPGSLL